MASVFEHPLELIYKAGKSLVINGVEIYELIHASINYYHKGDYFNFGKEIGLAMTIVFMKSHVAD